MSGMMRKLAYSGIFMKRIGWGYTHVVTLIPGERLARMEHWMAGRRAKPDYPVHISLVPEKPNNDGLSFPVESPVL
jgi:diadenosine tetraphosphate (Ap4A) HIT family hydrolase